MSKLYDFSTRVKTKASRCYIVRLTSGRGWSENEKKKEPERAGDDVTFRRYRSVEVGEGVDMPGADSSLPYSKGESDYCQTARIRQLVLAAQSGCAASFAEIRDLYWRRLFAIVISITRNPEDAEDVLQDTFLKAFIALQGFQWRSAFYTWLAQIAINSALMLLRRRRRRLETPFTVVVEDSSKGSQSRDLDFEDTTPSPEEVCSQRQSLLRLNAAIERLNPRLRTVLETHIREECSLRDV